MAIPYPLDGKFDVRWFAKVQGDKLVGRNTVRGLIVFGFFSPSFASQLTYHEGSCLWADRRSASWPFWNEYCPSRRALKQANQSAGHSAAAPSCCGGIGDSCESALGLSIGILRFLFTWDLISESLSSPSVLTGLGFGDRGEAESWSPSSFAFLTLSLLDALPQIRREGVIRTLLSLLQHLPLPGIFYPLVRISPSDT